MYQTVTGIRDLISLKSFNARMTKHKRTPLQYATGSWYFGVQIDRTVAARYYTMARTSIPQGTSPSGATPVPTRKASDRECPSNF